MENRNKRKTVQPVEQKPWTAKRRRKEEEISKQGSPNEIFTLHETQSTSVSEPRKERPDSSPEQETISETTGWQTKTDDKTETSSDDEGGFGQKTPPLTVYLQRILEKYPDGGQILKELVQNADDARAKNVIFMYDRTEYPRDSLHTPELRQFQGPALYAYNDGVFNENDWFNIQNPEQSGKKNEPTKVGRFGLGFNSVYHLTDLPSIMSGRRIGFLDPREKCFGEGEKGKSWKLTSKHFRQYQDQIKPFRHHIFNSDIIKDGMYPATIFRFPLRTEESELSKTIYDEGRMEELFASYQIDAEISLLYLKSVQSVSLYERTGCKEPHLRYRVKIAEDDVADLRREREKFVNACKDMVDNVQSDTDFRIERFYQEHSHASRYITMNLLKLTGVSDELRELTRDHNLKLLPWVSVTVPVSDISREDQDDQQHGRVFCFLPLPFDESPGFPIHVHGYFGLNDNRRGIKWPDKESSHDKQAKWNQRLIHEVFPEAYAKLLLQLIQTIDMKMPNDLYRCWPNVDDKRHPVWNEGIVALVRRIQNEHILYSEVDGGKWLAPKDVFLNIESKTDCSNLLQKVLLQMRFPVVKLPGHVLQTLISGGVEMEEVTPALLRKAICKNQLNWLNPDEKSELLEYILRDNQLNDLTDIYLLPLRDGTFTSFSKSLPSIFIPTEDTPAYIIPNLDHRFTASTLPKTLHSTTAQSSTQLIHFDEKYVVELLNEALPRNWINSSNKKVLWQPGRNDHPGEKWLSDIWTWLSHNRRKLPFDKLKEIPLLPVQTSTEETQPTFLVRLQPNTVILQKNQLKESKMKKVENGQEIPSCICSFLDEIGTVVVRHTLPGYIRDHPEIDHIIQPPNPEGVCEILAANKKHVVRRMKNTSQEEKDTFRMFLSELTPRAIENHCSFLVHLPMFQDTYKNYISVTHCKQMIPKDFNGIPVSHVKDVLICVGEENSGGFLRKLGCHEIQEEELLKTYILPQVSNPHGCYSDEEILQLMEWVLERSQYDSDVKSVNFIPTADGKKNSPQNLFDPDCQDLKLLFSHSPLFPSGHYLKRGLLEKIRRVGFRKSSSITALEFLTVVEEVNNSEEKVDASSRARILFTYINRNCHLLAEMISYNKITKAFSSFLEDKAWVPVVSSAAVGYPNSLAWFGGQSSLYKPRDVGPLTTSFLQGSTMPLVDMNGVSQTMKEAFGWHHELNHQNYIHVERVVCHLKNLCSSYSCDSDDSIYSRMVSDIYAFLNKAAPQHVQSAINTKLYDASWVWHGRGFTTKDKVAFDGGGLRVKLDPYLFVLPKAMNLQFLSATGVQKQFPGNVLCSVLESVQKANEIGNRSRIEIADDLSLVCDILNCIANSPHPHPVDILVPTRDDGNMEFLNLVNAQNCLYVDDQRLLDEYTKSDCELPVVHQKIPTETAKQLDLLPLSHYVAPTEAIDMGYDMEGPHETTVNAIRRNLELYKEGLDILKELIQNADDAGATQVKFLIDWRTNTDAQTSLLDKGMESCQGPALWAFNDAQFTETDVQNISNIAAATKKRELDKVGRFGLGFTSVYHLTDVPSFVSGPFIMIFDPRTTHLRKRVTAAKPGIKLDVRNNKHKVTLRSFPDQFLPFKDVFGCNVLDGNGYEHTLFRLPLRSEVEITGHSGEILSDAVYQSREKIQDLLRVFKRSSSTLLLFTQNIERVSVHILEEDHSPHLAEEVFSVCVNKKMQLDRSIKGPNSNLRTERNLLKAAAVYLPNLLEKDSDPKKAEVTNDNVESSMILEIHTKDNLYGKNKRSKSKSVYCVSTCMSKGIALEKAKSKDGRHAGILPCGGVATLLGCGREGLEPKCVEGQAFSFLPLEISTGLPFHINGTFLLQPNRRQMWSKTSNSKELKEEEFEIQWNVCLMVDVICKAFLNLLNDLKAAQNKDIVDARSFQTLWPTFVSVHSDFRPIVKGFYDLLCSEQNPTREVIHNGNRWVSLTSVVFTEGIPEVPVVKDAVITLINQHCRPQKTIRFLPPVYKSMNDSGVLRFFKENIFDWSRFIEDVFFPILKCEEEDTNVIDSNHRDIIIQHLLDERIGSAKVVLYDELLRTTECIPVSKDEDNLVTPCRLVHPKRLAGKLFHEGNMRFPYGGGYLKDERLLSLTELGMATDTMDWEDICERSETIACEEHFDDPSFQRSVLLLGMINQKLKDISNQESDGNISAPTPEQIHRIQCSPFLPTMDKEDYPFPWHSKGAQFKAASAIYEAKFSNLVGSVRCILDEKRLGADVMTDRVKEFLGIKNKEPPIDEIVEQIHIIIKEETKTHDHSTVVKICGDIYDFLQKKLCHLGGENQVLPAPMYLPQIEQLRRTTFLLADGKFVESKQLAFRFKNQCRPFLYNVPSILTPYTNLLKICGVREEFQPSDFLDVLIKLKGLYRGFPMNPDDITLAHNMLQYVIDVVSTKVRETFKGDLESEDGITESKGCLLQILETNSNSDKDRLLAVNNEGIIQEAINLTYNDMWWIEDQEFEKTHERLTLHNSRVLGIPTARERSLRDCSSSEGFDSRFGQTEELTNRLKTILRDYHHVSDVMKELLQNADDARATEIHFVYDSQTHQSEKIIHRTKWEPIQKLPALCVYNNRQFSKEDILGIQKVGVGGKLNDSSTAGRFGVGFNAVYHLTDCPTFITNNEKLCIFDPQVRYVPGASCIRPGRMFDCSSKFRNTFPDMLTVFLGDKFELNGSTMFRFPLRSKEMAETSTISTEWYDDNRMKTLLDEFKKIAKDSLFFLKHIEDIHISVIAKNGKMQEVYTISSKIAAADMERRQELTDHVEKYKDASDNIFPMTRVYSLDIKDEDGLDETWMVAQSVGFEQPLELEEDAQQRGLKHQIPRGGVAAMVRSNESISDKSTRWYTKRKVYCFLPLPIESKLPVHVNGSFALDSSRRHLAKSTGYFAQGDGSETSLAHSWNRHIAQEVIAIAYAHLIKDAKVMFSKIDRQISDNHIEAYFNLFPSSDYGDWNILAKSAMRCIDKHDMEVLPVIANSEDNLITWHHPNSRKSEAFFDDLTASNDGKNIRAVLLSTGFKLVTGPLKVCRAFVKAKVHSACVTPDEVLRHLTVNTQNVAPSLPCALNETCFKTHECIRAVIQYCLNSNSSIDLNRVPLRLTNNDMLSSFSPSHPVYLTTFLDLLPEKPDLFIHRSLVEIFQSQEDALLKSRVIRKFEVQDLTPYLQLHLPEEWRVGEKHVDWTPGENGHPTTLWIQRLWDFIFMCGESSPGIEWPIIPTTTSNLVFPKQAKTVVYLGSDSHCMTAILNKLKCPILDSVHLGSSSTSFFQLLTQRELSRNCFLQSTVASLDKREEVLFMFDHILQKRSLDGILNAQQSRKLLLYFQTAYPKRYKYIRQAYVLKKLPLFRTVNEELSSIDGYLNCHTCSCMIPMSEDVWKTQISCVFLEPDTGLEHLYTLLGITPITELDIYIKYILPKFKLLSQTAKEKHMLYIREYTLRNGTPAEKMRLLNCLENIDWIPDINGVLQKACYFYDPKVSVFRIMVEPSNLLPEKFASSLQWCDFLGMFGLNRTVTKELFLQYAHRIQMQASFVKQTTEREALMEKSKTLFDEFSRNQALRERNFLETLCNVKFIPPVSIGKNLIAILPACQGRLNGSGMPAFISFGEGIQYSHMKLAWSVAKVLPSYVVTRDNNIFSMESNMAHNHIVQHIRNVCNKMVKWNCCDVEDRVQPETRRTLNAVMCAMLEYLQTHNNQRTIVTKDLQDIPLCLVDNNSVLVRAHQIVFCTEEIVQLPMLRPYLYRAPVHMERYKSILVALGAQSRPTLKQLAFVLASIKEECGENEMHPNEMKTAYAAVGLIVKELIKRESSSCRSITETDVLYLPTTRGYLKRSTKLCSADPHLKKNLPESLGVDFVVELKLCGIDDPREDTKLLALLPPVSTPKSR